MRAERLARNQSLRAKQREQPSRARPGVAEVLLDVAARGQELRRLHEEAQSTDPSTREVLKTVEQIEY